MPPNAYRGRLFPAAEVRRILRRACEIDERARSADEGGRAHTLEDLQRVGADAGISEAALQRAMDGDLDTPARRSRPWSFSGGPATICVERSVRGTATPVNHAAVAKMMRAAIGDFGTAQVVGDSFTWSASTSRGRKVSAILEPNGEGQVAVRIEEDLRALRGALFGGLLGGLGGGGFGPIVAITARALPGAIPFILVVWMVLVYVAARAIYAARARARESQLDDLVGNVADLLETKRARIDSGLSSDVREAPRIDERDEELAAEDATELEATARARSIRSER